MAFFRECFIPRLYVADDSTKSSRGFVAFLIPPNGTPPDKAPELAEALASEDYQGTFVFSAGDPNLQNPTQATAFYQCIMGPLPANTRGMLWAHNIDQYADGPTSHGFSIDMMSIGPAGTDVTAGLAAILIPGGGMQLNVANGCLISPPNDQLQIELTNPGGAVVNFTGNLGPATSPVTKVTIDFAGPLRGCLRFYAAVKRGSIMMGQDGTLANRLPMGFRLMYLKETTDDYRTGFFPLAQTENDADDFILFDLCIDPTDAFNTVALGTAATDPLAQRYGSRRTYLNFVDPSELRSCYTTTFGAPITLLPVTTGDAALPARLVLGQGQNPGDYYLTPEGDFTIQINSAAGANDHFLLTGLQGTEFFRVTSKTETTPGDQLRFISDCPALAPVFPLGPASPTGPPQATGALLTAGYTTAWATLLPASGTALGYVAQPKGAALFGHDALIAAPQPSLFGHVAPSFAFGPDTTITFPLIPYSGAFVDQSTPKSNPAWFSQGDMQAFENLVVSPTRRQQVARLAPAQRGPQPFDATTPDGATITTPSGLLVTLPATGDPMQWRKVLLGQNTDGGQAYSLAFNNPVPQLIEALQTSDLLLVAANASYLINAAQGASFDGAMSIGGWGMQLKVGQNQQYGDYRNVLIIKGRSGKLYDPDSPANALLANPGKWTQPDTFAAPSTGTGPPDPSQLVNLSEWLHQYFAAAVVAAEAERKAGSVPYFGKFSTLAQDKDWTGILLLRVDLAPGKLPGSLAGIVAGVADTSAFNAHHLAIDISPVKKNGNDAALDHPSAMSGLIYYVDPAFVDTKPYATLPPSNTGTYDFRLLTLKVLFENTAVQSFESYAQLTLGSLFGSTVTGATSPDTTDNSANPYNNLLLKGNLQLSVGNPVYNLSTTQKSLFQLDSNIIRQVEITNALLTTRVSDDAQQAVFWFNLRGSLDFYALQNGAPPEGDTPADSQPFDLFSYGGDGSGDDAGKGLAFGSLGIRMTYPLPTPAKRTLTFDTSELRFDLSLSTPRDFSLVTNFALDEVVLLTGTANAGPDTLGYLPVISDLRLDGLSGDWYGLKFLLKLGTPGELAGKASLNAYLLLAWSASSTADGYAASVQLALPGTTGGASLISLQNVLKLSIGQIRLAFVPPAGAAAGRATDAGTPAPSSFLLMFTEIALTFLGLLKIPPTGSTVFYLFGNPNASGKASGLGWYAMYKKAVPAKLAARALPG